MLRVQVRRQLSLDALAFQRSMQAYMWYTWRRFRSSDEMDRSDARACFFAAVACDGRGETNDAKTQDVNFRLKRSGKMGGEFSKSEVR